MLELLSVAAFTNSKSANRKNEDSVLLPIKKSKGYLFGIADGVGSYAGASHASKFVIDYLTKLEDIPYEDEVEKLLLDIKNGLSSLELIDKNFDQAATTLTLGFINDEGLQIIHVGDSRLYIKRSQKLIKLTVDHTQHQKLLDEGLFTERQLKKMDGKNILMTALSKKIALEYQYSFFPWNEIENELGSVIINVMSDGAYTFWEKRPKFSDNTMSNPTAFSTSLQRRIEKIGAVDDYSLISLKFVRKSI